MNKKIIASVSLLVLAAMPMIASADIPNPTIPEQQGGNVIDIINTILNFIWPVFIGVAVIFFLVAAFIFVTANGDPGKVGAARQSLLWGVIGIVVGVIAFSLPFLIQNTIQP